MMVCAVCSGDPRVTVDDGRWFDSGFCVVDVARAEAAGYARYDSDEWRPRPGQWVAVSPGSGVASAVGRGSVDCRCRGRAWHGCDAGDDGSRRVRRCVDTDDGRDDAAGRGAIRVVLHTDPHGTSPAAPTRVRIRVSPRVGRDRGTR